MVRRIEEMFPRFKLPDDMTPEQWGVLLSMTRWDKEYTIHWMKKRYNQGFSLSPLSLITCMNDRCWVR
jgi:hypothetical protein